jgi:4-hydroxy-tetrahydrodipicolinate reductase
MMTIRVCLAGATGWAGSALARAIAATEDIQLAAAVSRSNAGQKLGDVLGESLLDCVVYGTAAEALKAGCDVFFDYTRPEAAKQNVLTALDAGANCVVGTSGLTEADYAEIAAAALDRERAVLAVGNFSMTAVLLEKFAQIAARHIPQWEIFDYASDGKPDAPSGTVRELAFRLSHVRPSELTVPLDKTQGLPETRGARLQGSQVHSVRLPGYTISAEVVFGKPGERLSIRHDSDASPEPYLEGALTAIRKVGSFKGLRRGLTTVLDLD